ncbi:MAG: hypothetical protein FWF63_02555 [Fibromonadales bacterium]|nr:hypothetical protein [Fibromonadales bacterium]
MSEALNAEKILASIVELRESIVESRKDTTELRESIVESRKDTAELRESIVELRAGIAESRKDTAELRERMDEQGRRMDEQWKRSEQAAAELRERMDEQWKRSEQAAAELRERMDEQGKRMDEQGKRMDEQGRRIDKMLEEFAEARAELKKNTSDLAETRAHLEKNNRKLDENNHIVGKLTNKFGKIVEKILLPGIVDKFNEKGFKFDAVSANVEFLNEKKDGNIAEVDALLENGKFVIAVETKTELTIKDVNAHIKRLQALHKVLRFKGKKIYGAFSTAVVKPKPIKYALENGFYVLQQPDAMAIKILDFPKGHSAKAW